MPKVCGKILDNTRKLRLITRVLTPTDVSSNTSLGRSIRGEAWFTHVVVLLLYTDFYTRMYDFFNLLMRRYTHFPQLLLLQRRREN